VIFDSCHSGSGTRSGSDTRVRGGPYEGEIPDNLDDDIVLPRTRGARVPDKFRHHGLQSHILLAACASHELAHENRNSGAFTAALLKALKGVDTAELTYEGLIERMDKLKTYVPRPPLQGHIFKERADSRLSVKATTGAGSSSTGRLPTPNLFWT
jgi:hypothetical protein